MGEKELSRRTLLQQGALLAGLGVVGGGDANSVANMRNWQSQRPDHRNHPGLVPDESIKGSNGSNPRTDLGVIWKQSVNAARRPLYVNDTLLVGTSSGLVAVNPENGNQVFQLRLGNTRGSPPVFHNGSVYVAADNGQADTIYAIDLLSQAVRWQNSTEYIESANTAIPRRMTTAEDTLFASANGAGIYAFSTDTGAVKWQFKPSTGNFPYITTTPAISEERVFVASFETGEIYAIKRQSGKLDWTRNVSAEMFHPIITDGTVYISGQDQVWALDTTSGSVEWTRDIQYAAEYDGRGAYDSDNIYLTGRSDGQYVYALDLELGTTRWKTEASGGKVRLAGNVLYVINARGPIVTINPETGEKLGSINQGTHASIGNGKIYAVDMWKEKVFAIGEGAPANFSVSPSTPTTDERVRLVAETHESITRYEWAIDSNQFKETGPKITKTFTQPDYYRVRLRVTTTNSATNTAEKTILVQKAGSEQDISLGLATAAILGGIISLGGGFIYRRRASDNKSVAGSSDDDDESIAQDSQPPTDQLFNSAENSYQAAQQARNQGNYQTALDQFNTAIDQYTTAETRLPDDDDQQDVIARRLETARTAVDQIRKRQELRESLTESLERAEYQLEVALTAEADGDLVGARSRYRQARDQYDQALSELDDAEIDPFKRAPVVVSRDTQIATPPSDPTAVPKVGNGKSLAELGIDSQEAFEQTDTTELAPVLEMAATAWWEDETEMVVPNREAIEWLRTLAAEKDRELR